MFQTTPCSTDSGQLPPLPVAFGSDDESQLREGQTLKHFCILHKIGEGGMGEVYQAEDLKLGRQVAIKLLPAAAATDENAKFRLLREARSASALNHPNIVTIHSIEEAEEFHFIVMEYVEGETLRAVIRRDGALAPPRLFDIGAQVADALAAAHSLNIIHRDIKSDNILLTPSGQAKVLDFGIAKILPVGTVDCEALTMFDLTGRNGVLIGTIPYMSPEQTRGEPLDARTDVFSLGCVLYEAATGALPFRGPSLLSVIHEIAVTHPAAPSALSPALPQEFDLIVERALAKERTRRYASATELADALKTLRGALSESFTTSQQALVSEAGAGTEAFFGREAELERLNESLRQSLEDSGRIVFITGEPGIGKTTLIETFLRRARAGHPGLTFARGRCVEQYGPGEAYLPFLDAVGALLTGARQERIAAVLRTHAPTWCLQFPAAFPSGATDLLRQETIGATKERMLRELGDALAALAANAPVVLLLEDLHWADPSSIDLLRHLSQHAGQQRLLILGTLRPEDVELNEHPLKKCKLEMGAHKLCEEIMLTSPGAEYIAAYLASLFTPNDFPAGLFSLIERKTEGHPLFVNSLVQFLAERGDIKQTNEGWSLARPLAEMNLEAPENIRSMIRKRLEPLGEEDRRTLQYASVEGEEFISTVVAASLGMDELLLEERLAVLDRTHRLILTVGEEELPDGQLATRYRFAHALYRDVLYSDLVIKRRALLHRQAGEQLVRHYGAQAPRRIAAQLAVHFERGRDFARAVEYLSHAGDNAAGLYANAEAAEHYSQGIRLAERLPVEEQTAHLLTLHQKRGAVNLALGRFQEAVDDHTEMLTQARLCGSPDKESAALNALVMTLFYSHRLDEIAARADEIVRAAERSGSDALRIEAMQLLALKHLGYGELDKARPMLDEIIQAARDLEHQPVLLVGLAWRGILHFFQTEYAEAEAMLLEAQSLASELRDGFLLLESYFVLGMTRGNQGRLSEALATFAEGLEIAERNGDRFWSPRMPNCIGWIYRELQDFEEAHKYNRQGLDVGREANVLEAQANSLINIGIDHKHRGESEKTVKAFREVEGIFRRDAWFRWRYQIRLQAGKCEHLLADGDLEGADEHARELLKVATHFEARKYIAAAHHLLAQIAQERGDYATAGTELLAAIRQLGTHPVPVLAWKVYAELGRLHLHTGDALAARKAFTQAAVIVNEIAVNIDNEKLRQTFLNSNAIAEALNFVREDAL